MVIGAILCFVVSLIAAEPGNKDIRAKARHFYLKGTLKEAEGNMDEAYEYYKKAYLTDSTYLEAAYNYTLGKLNSGFGTLDRDPNSMAGILSTLKEMAETYPQDPDFSETYAYYLVQTDSLQEALNVYKRLLSHQPGLARLYLSQAYLYAMREETDSAVQAMRDYERLQGISSETTLRKASYHLAKGDTISALQEFRTYAESNPQDIETLMNVSMAYTLLGQQDSAYNIVKDAAVRYPDNMALRFELALIAKEAGDIDEFYRSSRMALTSPETDDDVKIGMLEDYVENLPSDSEAFKKTDSLMEELAKTLSDELPFLKIYANYGILKKDMPLAYENVKKSYALAPEDPDMLGSLMTFAVLAGQPLEGLEAFEEFKGKGKKDYNLLLTYITAAENAKEYERGIAGADTLLNMYVPGISVRDGKLTAGRVDSIAPDTAMLASSVYEVTAELYSKQNKRDDVIRCYENAIILSPNNVSVKNNYAYYLVETMKVLPGTAKFEEAKKMSYETLMSEDAPYFYYDTYAWILFKARDFKEALKYQEIAIEKAGADVIGELLDHYGDILFMNGMPEEALEQWKKALELEPDDAKIKKKIDNKAYFYE